MYKVSQLFIYPIKSLGGISLESAEVTERGLEYDRRWMLIDEHNEFMTIRQRPSMTLLKPSLMKDGLMVSKASDSADHIFVPFDFDPLATVEVTVWKARCKALHIDENIDKWFSAKLGKPCKLVYMPEDSRRPVDPSSGIPSPGKIASFSDAYPFLLIGQASMDDLNERLSAKENISIQRFRPNIVFSGGQPYDEDGFQTFEIGPIQFIGKEKCVRCNVPNVDPETAEIHRAKEPMATLAKYRRENNKIYFGQNLVHEGSGMIHVGDELRF